MDLVKIGKFLAELRREKGYTQEELGEKIGVTNKTVSRWENGNYLPGVDMLQILSQEYAVSINELLCGERLQEENYKENAEKTLVSVLSKSAFSLKERCAFYKKKWCKEHLAVMILCAVVFFLVTGIGIVSSRMYLVAAGMLVGVAAYLFLYNRMMAYVEQHAYDGKGNQ